MKNYMRETKRLGFRRYEAQRGSTFTKGSLVIKFRINPLAGVGIVKRKTEKSYPKEELLETTLGIRNSTQGLNWSMKMMRKYQ